MEKKLDPIALIALVLTLVNSAYSLYSFKKGARLRLIPPEQVLIRSERFRSGRELVLFSARLTCVNKGAPGYGGVIEQATISFNLGGQRFEHVWQDFGYSQLEDLRLKLQRTEDAHPIGVEGGTVVSQETFFYPRSTVHGGSANFLGWEEFLKRLASADHVDFRLKIKEFEDRSQSVLCRVQVTDQLRQNLATGKWAAPGCVALVRR
jgi:hypothetical protein